MTDDDKRDGASKPDGGKPVGDAQGGADASGAGNILAGVQPDAGKDEQDDERRDD